MSQLIPQSILEALTDAYTNNQLIPVVGSGLSIPFGLPNWEQLLQKAAKRVQLSNTDKAQMENALQNRDYLQATDVLLKQTTMTEEILQQEVAKIMSEAKKNVAFAEVDNNYTDLSRMEYARFLTTNYDEYLNNFTGTDSVYLSQLCDGTIKANEFTRKEYRKRIIPIHGEIRQPNTIVLSRKSYERLYQSDEFEHGFQFLRSGYTFLFLGFSFDDKYFKGLFEKMIGRFESRHYILLDKGQVKTETAREELQRKVETLHFYYGVETIFYDSEKENHIKGIRKALTQIIQFKDNDLNLSGLKKLADIKQDKDETGEVGEILEQCQRAVDAEQLSKVKAYCDAVCFRKDFEKLSVLIRQKVYCYQIWYYSYLGDFDTPQKIIAEMDQDEELRKHREACVFMFAQALWNARRWDDAAALFEKVTKKSKIEELMQDIILYTKKIIPDRKERAGKVKVYEEVPWEKEKKENCHKEYLVLKEKYVNPETYNLLEVSAYENADNQSCAYYWLGVTAGQVFHEHYEAIEYLNRALEITADRKTYEELAQNYLAQAEEKIKYRKNAKYYEIDKASLLKAKRCFQYAMQTDDEEMRLSVYRKSGAAYLQVLFHLKRYYDYEEFFARAEKVLPDSYELFMQKAECDALFYYEVSEERLNALKKNDRIYIEAVRDFAKAGFYQGQKKEDESKELYRKIISVIEGLAVTDMRFRALFHDSFFFLGDAEGYNRYADLWDSDMQGFGQEINARIAEAEKTLIFAYEQNPDISTFSMLNGFYVRQHMKNESEVLYENALSEKAPFVSERVDLIRGYLLQQLHIWGDLGHAVEIFLEYQREFDEDLLSKQEIVEILKQETADYGDVDNRVQWNRYLLKIAPKAAAAQMYRCMFFLYVSNFRYKEAEEILLEMQRSGYSVPKEWRSIHDILMRPQKKQIYFRGVINFSADFLAGLKEKMRGNSLFFRYCFGAENKEVLLPISWILLLFQFGRQKELERFKTVYIVYAGVVNLQKSLCGKEDALLRMALQNLQKADNIKITAPSLEGFYNQIKGKKKCQMEAVQLKAYKKEHPEIWCPV